MTSKIFEISDITVQRMPPMKGTVEYFEIVLSTELGDFSFGFPQSQAERLVQLLQSALSEVQQDAQEEL